MMEVSRPYGEGLHQPVTQSETEARAEPVPACDGLLVSESLGPSSERQKRKLGSVDFQNSTFFKIRSMVADLRPHFVEVIHAPDIRNCKAADEIRKQLQVLLELTTQLKAETSSLEQPKSLPEPQIAPHIGDKEHQVERSQKEDERVDSSKADKKADKHQKSAEKTIEERFKEYWYLKSEAGRVRGSYIVGGSPLGWNFIMYPGTEVAYYGESKENFLVRKAASKATS